MSRQTFSVSWLLGLALFVASLGSAVGSISPGTPITTNAGVPSYLTDGSYPFSPFGVVVTLGQNQFLLPVEISGAANLQSWQFDLLYDETVVTEVQPDPIFIGDFGIYGARFTPADSNALSNIQSGFPFFPGLVDDVAGAYPLILSGPSGSGPLAFILFEFLPDQNSNDPDFRIENVSVLQAPEPGTLALLGAGLILLASRRLIRREQQS